MRRAITTFSASVDERRAALGRAFAASAAAALDAKRRSRLGLDRRVCRLPPKAGRASMVLTDGSGLGDTAPTASKKLLGE